MILLRKIGNNAINLIFYLQSSSTNAYHLILIQEEYHHLTNSERLAVTPRDEQLGNCNFFNKKRQEDGVFFNKLCAL